MTRGPVFGHQTQLHLVVVLHAYVSRALLSSPGFYDERRAWILTWSLHEPAFARTSKFTLAALKLKFPAIFVVHH